VFIAILYLSFKKNIWRKIMIYKLRQLFKNEQPKNFYFLFFVEMWERFGFYSMTCILTLYLSKVFLFSDEKSYAMFGVFSSLLWFTPMFGGQLADRLLGLQRSIIVGAIFLILGYFCLGIKIHWVFYFGLGLLLIGNGLFKTNIPALVGILYDGQKDPRRDSGFTIYYMGINIGALLGPIVVGIVVEKISWQAGFFAASIGMALGLLLFLVGRKGLGHYGAAPSNPKLFVKHAGMTNLNWSYAACIVVAIIGAILLFHATISITLMIILGALGVGYYIYAAFKQIPANRNRMMGCLILVAFSVAFWTLYQQAPMTLNLFTDRNIDRHVFGILIPTETFQSFNPLFIFLFTPFLSWYWRASAKTIFNLSTATKFSWGIIIMSLGFLVLTWSIDLSSTGQNISAWWVIWSYAVQSLAELMISPIGLSMMTAMAPPNMQGMMMGIWFLSSAVANALAGYVAQFASVPDNIKDPHQAALIYSHAFSLYGWMGIGVGVIAVLCIPMLKKMMSEHKEMA
jgi:POT family proton-dependent oligopeptide transporter